MDLGGGAEVKGKTGQARVCSAPFSGEVEMKWPVDGRFVHRGIYLSCGDSADTGLPDHSVDSKLSVQQVPQHWARSLSRASMSRRKNGQT